MKRIFALLLTAVLLLSYAPALPWDIAISYTLDGEPVDAAELGGMSGRLGIDISIVDGGMEDGSFYDNFMVQVSVTMNSQICRNITAEGATIANSGSDKQINFTAMPGTDSEFALTADVTDVPWLVSPLPLCRFLWAALSAIYRSLLTGSVI